MQKEVLTAREVAKRWNVSAMHIYRLVKKGDIPALKIGEILRFRLADIEEAERRFTTTEAEK